MFNGKPLSFSNRWAFEYKTCPACRLKSQAEYEIRSEREREEERRVRLESFLGGQRAYNDYTFEKFDHAQNTDAYHAALGFDPSKQNLYLWGPCGVGKSHLAYAIARRTYETKGSVSACIYKPPALMRDLRGLEPNEEADRIDRLAHTPVFVLDDLGVGKATEFAVQMLYEIADARSMAYRNGLVVTSNLSLDQLAQKIGDDRLASRLGGMCKGNIYEMKGRDFRI